MAAETRLVVFTDLDGTLLDHDTYSFQPALPALDVLRKTGVPVVLTTSKTAAETAALRRELDLDAPFITENGAQATWPEGYFAGLSIDGAKPTAAESGELYVEKLFGPKRDQILAALRAIGREQAFQYRGFADMDAAEVSERTGLPPERAELALRRMGSEPLVWQDSPEALDDFSQRLRGHGLHLVRGGRFQHVIGHGGKGEALRWVLALYRQREPSAKFLTIALGDSPNDAAMLSAADYAVVVRSQLSEQLQPTPSIRTVRTVHRGPEGWNEAMRQLLPIVLSEEVLDG